VKKVWGFWVKKIIVYVLSLKNPRKQNNKAHELKYWYIIIKNTK
jgi:hypothetical protein